LEEKQLLLTVITGPMGVGKTTMASNVGQEYDTVFGTDTGMIDDTGRYVFPDNVPKVYRERMDEVMRRTRAGENILLEGYPNALMRRKGLIAEISFLMP
jgi:shikimate kinase